MPILVGDQLNYNSHSNDQQRTSSSGSESSHDGSKVRKLLQHVQSAVLPRRISFNKSTTLQEDPKAKYLALNRVGVTPPQSATPKTEHKEKEVLNEDGFQEPKKILFPKVRVNDMMAWKKTTGAGSGLNNHGNTCFLNSVVQCLSYTPPLANYLLSREHSSNCKIVGFCMMCILERHVARALATGGAISPSEVVQNLRKIAPGFRPGRQEDAHEFLRFVIESAQKSCLFPLQKDKSITNREAQTTVVGSIFGGYLQSQVKCSECHYESNTYDPFMDLCVDLSDKVESLTGALLKFIKPEILDARNMYMCSKCKRRVRAQKRMRIYQAPPILTIQLKRFNFFQMYGGKINRPIKFEQRLDLEPYMTKPSSEGPIIYNLYGVLVHAGGSTNSGHYYSFVKAPNGEWYLMDDQSVTKVSLGTVLQQRAYILFYARASPSRSTTPTRTPPSPSSSLSTIHHSVSTSTTTTTTTTSSTSFSTSVSTSSKVSRSPPNTPSSGHLNGLPRDPDAKTYVSDPKDKSLHGKAPLLMSNTPTHQQKQQPQKSPVSPSPSLKPQKPTPTTTNSPPAKSTTPSPSPAPATKPTPSRSPLSPPSPPSPSHPHSSHAPNGALLAPLGHSGKRKEREEREDSKTPLLRKKPRVESDPSVLCFNGIWTVRDVEKTAEKEEKMEEERSEVDDKSAKKQAKLDRKLEKKKAKMEKKRAKLERKETEKEKESSEGGNSIWKRLFSVSTKDDSDDRNDEVMTNHSGEEAPAANGNHRAENGKHENGKHENGKHENGKHENGKLANGKHVSENGKPALNGKHPSENGKHPTENGKLANGKHVSENGKHPTENGKHPTENGKHALPNGNGVQNGFANGKTENKANGKKASSAVLAANFLKSMEAVRDSSSIFGTKVGTWDDVEEAAEAVKQRQEGQKKQGPVSDRLFQERDEWDVEYDMGRTKKKRNRDLFANKSNLFQSAADDRSNRKNEEDF